MNQSEVKYEVKERGDGSRCIYLADHDVVLAEFARGTKVDAENIGRILASHSELFEACQMMRRWMDLQNEDDPEIEELTLQTVMEHVESALAKATPQPERRGSE